MAKEQQNEEDDEDGTLPSEPFEGLLVKISSGMGGGVGGKMYLFPRSVLPQYEFSPQSQGSFDTQLSGKLINVEFAVYSPGFVVYASAGG
jgi:hypothetical protein